MLTRPTIRHCLKTELTQFSAEGKATSTRAADVNDEPGTISPRYILSYLLLLFARFYGLEKSAYSACLPCQHVYRGVLLEFYGIMWLMGEFIGRVEVCSFLWDILQRDRRVMFK